MGQSEDPCSQYRAPAVFSLFTHMFFILTHLHVHPLFITSVHACSVTLVHAVLFLTRPTYFHMGMYRWILVDTPCMRITCLPNFKHYLRTQYSLAGQAQVIYDFYQSQVLLGCSKSINAGLGELPEASLLAGVQEFSEL